MTVAEALDGLFAAWRAGDAVRAAAYFRDDATYVEARGRSLAGRDAIRAHFTAFFRDGPRFRFDVDDTLVDGARAAVRYRFTTFDERDGERAIEGCAFATFIDGTLARWREYEG